MALILFILAFLLRIIGAGYGLPDLFHQDEPIIVNHALSIGAAGWNTHFFVIPPFTMYLLFVLSGVYYLIFLSLGIFHSTADFAVSFLKDPSSIYWIGRTVLGALFGAATVFCVWFFSKKLFSRKIAFRAAILLAVLPIHVQHSHYIYADIPMTLGVTLAFFILLLIADKPVLGRYLLYGAVLGWAATVKYTALYFAPTLLVAEGLSFKEIFNKGRWARIVLSGAACVATFMILFPFSWLDWPRFWAQMAHQSGAEGFVSPLHQFIYSVLGGSGILFVLASGIGLFSLLKTKASYARVFLVFLTLYFAVSVFFSQPYARYMLPLMPVLAILAAFGVEKMEVLLGDRRKAAVFAALLFLELLIPTLYGDFLFTQKDTRAQCKEWFLENVAADTAVALDHRFFGPHLDPNKDQINEKYDALTGSDKDAVKKMRLDHLLTAAEGHIGFRTYWIRPDGKLPQDEFLFSGPYVNATYDDLVRAGVRYLVIHYFDPRDDPQKLLESISGKCDLVRSFSPYWDKMRRLSWDPQSNTGAPHLLAELISRKNLGPYIEVYRIHE